jgi:predicted glycosyl hydrolase (DUF1957 family)
VGVFSLVLHTHLPYVRRNGVWPSGEDFFHQAATESYLPLLTTLERLASGPAREPFLTLGVTPLIGHQLEDPYMLRELSLYLGGWDLRALWQVANYEGVYRDEFKDIAAFYARHARRQLARLESLPGGIARGFGDLEGASGSSAGRRAGCGCPNAPTTRTPGSRASSRKRACLTSSSTVRR